MFRSVQKKFGTLKINSIPHITLFKLIYCILIRRIKTIPLLNFVDFNKKQTEGILSEKIGWQHYGGKHYESIYTRFVQGYLLPKKFNIDKRRAHLSTLICSGQMSREEALIEIEKNPYPNAQMENEDYEFVLKKLGITHADFETILSSPIKNIYDYPNNFNLIERLRLFLLIIKQKNIFLLRLLV